MEAKRPPEYSPQTAFWQRVFILIPVVFSLGALALVWLPNDDGDDGGRSDASKAAKAEPSPEEVDLEAVLAWIGAHPSETGAALERLDACLARLRSPATAERCRAWRQAIASSAASGDFQVTLRAFALDREAYRRRFHSRLEPGRPDVYVRFWRRKAGGGTASESFLRSRTEEAWSRRWSGDAPHAWLRWALGDEVSVELCEADIFGDNVIASWKAHEGLSIFLLRGVLRSPEGHTVELEVSPGPGE